MDSNKLTEVHKFVNNCWVESIKEGSLDKTVYNYIKALFGNRLIDIKPIIGNVEFLPDVYALEVLIEFKKQLSKTIYEVVGKNNIVERLAFELAIVEFILNKFSVANTDILFIIHSIILENNVRFKSEYDRAWNILSRVLMYRIDRKVLNTYLNKYFEEFILE